MADVPETKDGTSGPLAWLLAVPILAFVVGVPFLAVTMLISTSLAALNGVVAIPVVTLGLFEAAGLPATLMGIPLLYSTVPALLVSLYLLARTGLDWEGTESSGGSTLNRWR